MTHSSLQKKKKLFKFSRNKQFINISEIIIPRAKRDKDGKRIYDKLYYCPYCGKGDYKLPQHLEKCHSDEPAVKKTINTKDKKERKFELERLRHLGNFHHNMKV